eukprot:TRINITY_DN24390_c0_g2_i2.p1 TRINITY_DN24390_c0_g2~~TRINITY_DN24390_c0_g2_i2.p1  ORF type:complete len:555 (+),score=195.51 TRINITY_DN24390_c0_g2_i2:41-1705(+)
MVLSEFPESWRELCPHLAIEGFAKNGQLSKKDKKKVKLADTQVTDEQVADLKRQMMDNGVFRFEQIVPRNLCEQLASGVQQLEANGYPASFIILFDVVWEVVRVVQTVLQKTTSHKNIMNFDILSWHIDPSKDQSGFSPHRDRQPEDVKSSFFTAEELAPQDKNYSKPEDATLIPKYATCWLALTKACPENSCLYMLPKPSDPGYAAGDNHDDPRDPLEVAINGDKRVFQNIKAFPLQVGSAVVFSHRILHWGSKGRPGYPEARISLSFAVSEPGYEEPYLKDVKNMNPSFQMRLALVSAQMLIYHERFNFSSQQLHNFYKCFDAHRDMFNPKYQKQVEKEFVDAVKEKTAETIAPTEDEALDAAMEVVLQNAMQGGDVDDDFQGSDAEVVEEDEDENVDEKDEELPIAEHVDGDQSGQITAEKFAELAAQLSQGNGKSSTTKVQSCETSAHDDEKHSCCAAGSCDDPKERVKMFVGAIREIYELSQMAAAEEPESRSDSEEESTSDNENAMTYERFAELAAKARAVHNNKKRKGSPQSESPTESADKKRKLKA